MSSSGSEPTPVEIRPARSADVERMRQIEVDAGQLFRTVGLDAIADHDPFSAAELGAYLDGDRAWVLVDGEVVAGYVVVDELDGAAHVEQLTVAPSHQRRGLGATLLAEVEAWARGHGCDRLTLTTFTDVAWNGPYYERLGFKALTEGELTPGLAALRATEAEHGLDPTRRVCMERPLP